MRLIDADKLKADCGMADRCEECPQDDRLCGRAQDYTKMDFCDWIDEAKTVDAITVVRCMDCKYSHYELDQDDSHGWRCTLGNKNNMRCDFYCESGERKR